VRHGRSLLEVAFVVAGGIAYSGVSDAGVSLGPLCIGGAIMKYHRGSSGSGHRGRSGESGGAAGRDSRYADIPRRSSIDQERSEANFTHNAKRLKRENTDPAPMVMRGGMRF